MTKRSNIQGSAEGRGGRLGGGDLIPGGAKNVALFSVSRYF